MAQEKNGIRQKVKKGVNKVFIKINANETVNCNEAIINTDQIAWIDVKDRRIWLTNGSNLFVPKSEELNRITEKIRAKSRESEAAVEIVKTDETKENEIKYLNINVSDSEVMRNPDVVRLHSDAGVLEYVACGRMNEQWKQLKETIIDIKDNNKFEHEDATLLCQFLINYMDVLEKRVKKGNK